MSLNACHVLHCAIKVIAVQTKRSHALSVCRCHGSLTFHYGFIGMIPSVVFAMYNAITPVELALPQNNPCKVDRCFIIFTKEVEIARFLGIDKQQKVFLSTAQVHVCV